MRFTIRVVQVAMEDVYFEEQRSLRSSRVFTVFLAFGDVPQDIRVVVTAYRFDGNATKKI